jgi:hypothetical protein
MFTAIFKEATGYFDRRSLLSTFFPFLLFWGVVIVVVSSHYRGWAGTIAWWNRLNGTAQALLIVAFLSWVALWTFIMLNFQPGLLRLFDGEWPESVLSNRLLAWRRRHWEASMAALEDSDTVLAAREADLRAEARSWEAFPPEDGASHPEPPDGPWSRAGAVADLVALSRQALSAPPTDGNSADAALADLGQKVRDASLATASEAETSAQEKVQLAALVTGLQDEVARRLEQVRAERAAVHYSLSRYFPENAALAPTRLGNAMRAVETYGRPRYGLDLATIWPRLQPLLPAETLSWLEQAGGAFELMVTLSALSALFGVPLSVYLAVIASAPTARAVSAAVLLGSAGLSWVCYRNAVEAAVAYGERVRSTVDLHRFDVFEAMRLPQPDTLAEEELQWRRVCGLLDRSDRADPAAWRYTHPEPPAAPAGDSSSGSPPSGASASGPPAKEDSNG